MRCVEKIAMKVVSIRRDIVGALTVVVCAFSTVTVEAATYYVSQSSGNDAWTGRPTGPKGKVGPWKTLKRACLCPWALPRMHFSH